MGSSSSGQKNSNLLIFLKKIITLLIKMSTSESLYNFLKKEEITMGLAFWYAEIYYVKDAGLIL